MYISIDQYILGLKQVIAFSKSTSVQSVRQFNKPVHLASMLALKDFQEICSISQEWNSD